MGRRPVHTPPVVYNEDGLLDGRKAPLPAITAGLVVLLDELENPPLGVVVIVVVNGLNIFVDEALEVVTGVDVVVDEPKKPPLRVNVKGVLIDETVGTAVDILVDDTKTPPLGVVVVNGVEVLVDGVAVVVVTGVVVASAMVGAVLGPEEVFTVVEAACVLKEKLIIKIKKKKKL